MNKQLLYVSVLGGMLMLTGCNKKLGQFNSSYFTTVPTPLETVGENVPGTVRGSIPAKFMVKNAKVTAVPVLTWTSGSTTSEATAQPTVFQGQDVRANGQEVSYDNGGTVVIPFNIPYRPEMAQSDLYLDFSVDQNGKMYKLPRVKVGYGIVATSTLANARTVTPAVAKDNFQRVISQKYSADIHFLINQANIRANQTNSTGYIDLNKKLMEANQAKNQEIAGINISSYASPEGSLEFNTELAEKREKNTTNYVENQLKKDKIAEFGELTSSFTPEDWAGFEQLVEKSNIQDKDLILSVLKMYPDPQDREREIRNMSSVFNELADQILPQLRYSRVQAVINTIGKSDQELVDLFNTDPEKLTEDEMLYIATLTNDNMKKMEVYNRAAELHPDDYRAFNNLGDTQYIAGDYSGAAANWAQAQRLNPNAKEVKMNMGLVAMMNGDNSKANELLGEASGVPESADALGTYFLNQGDVQKAITAFGDSKTNNAAVAQIMAKDYTAAKNILDAVPVPDGVTYYLKAVTANRLGNQTDAMTNLKQAVKMDKSLLARAQRDLEFSKMNLSFLN